MLSPPPSSQVYSFAARNVTTLWKTLYLDVHSCIIGHGWHMGLLITLAALVLWLLARSLRPSNYKGQLPPGPQGLPYFGNMFQLKANLWEPFTEWSDQYGRIVHIHICGKPIVIINDLKTAYDLLDARSSIYSDRSRNIVCQEILWGGLNLALCGYNDLWRKMRKAAREGLSKNASYSFSSLTTREAVNLVSGLTKDPSLYRENLKRASASIILSAIYDVPSLESVHDPNLKFMDEVSSLTATALQPGAYLVEFFTWMKYLPSWMAPWKKNAEYHHREFSKYFEGMFDAVNERVMKGDDRPSFCSTLIRDKGRNKLSKLESAWLAAILYFGGEDTTTRTMSWFLQAMQVHPKVQKRAQKELDEVVGRSRMPTFQDIDRLPYINAVVKEVLRHRPVVPTGLPHISIKDDFYDGYFIPKGTSVFTNIWAMHLDKDVFGEDAHIFNPDRYLEENISTAINNATKGQGHVSFGFGRRICPGRHLASASLFLEIACVLWAANIEPPKDKNGQPIMPDTSVNARKGFMTLPEPFDCLITFRFPEAEGIVAQTKEALS